MSKNHRISALTLSIITVVYNLIEGVISLIAAYLSGSAALLGFGLDSMTESLSGSIMIWRFLPRKFLDVEKEKQLEKKAITLIPYTFFILAAYVAYESSSKLIGGRKPDPSVLGMIIAVISLITMPILFYFKYKTGRKLDSPSLIADSKQTLACMFLSLSLFIGLSLNYFFHIWWADPLIGYIIVIYLIREGYVTLKKKEICAC